MKICIRTHVENSLISKILFFRSTTKNNEVIAEKPFQNSGVTRRLWRFQHATALERSIEVGFSLILSIYNYKVVYVSIKDLHAGNVATRCRNLLLNLPKMRIWIGRNRTNDDVQPSIFL